MNNYHKTWLLSLIALLFSSFSNAQQRETLDLTSGWNITLDMDAPWQDDKLYLPPVDLNYLPINIPTGGWQLLDNPNRENISLPATVEGSLWGIRGDKFGVNGNYTGVSWFTTNVFIPKTWEGKNIILQVGAVRFRAEIFINKELAGYDLINSTPFDVSITDYVKYGAENEIAFRITDPNGNFNWKDSQVYSWGEYLTNPSHGFGGITGKVSIVATDQFFIEDVFIKNTSKPTNIEVDIQLKNQSNENSSQPIRIEITEAATGKVVFNKEYPTVVCPKEKMKEVSYPISIPTAKLWSPDSPTLYNLTVSTNNDSFTRRFGFRWFEIGRAHV